MKKRRKNERFMLARNSDIITYTKMYFNARTISPGQTTTSVAYIFSHVKYEGGMHASEK